MKVIQTSMRIFLFRILILSNFIGGTFFQLTSLTAQLKDFKCPSDFDPNQPIDLPVSGPCINVDEILSELENGDHCRLIHLNVNVHFYLPSNCQGNLLWPWDKKPSDVNQLAEDLIIKSNLLLASNPIQMNGTGIKLCNPFRYVLRGVYIHCFNSQNKFDISYLSSFANLFNINKLQEINIHIAPCPYYGCNGSAIKLGNNGNTIGLQDLEPGILNHEMGHLLNLMHTFDIFEDLSDTPNPYVDIDFNCDGIISDDPGPPREKHVECAEIVPSYDPNEGLTVRNDQIGDVPRSDHPYLKHNGIHDCLESTCQIHPCCNPVNVSNNVMGYNNIKSSFTYQQLRKMLINVNDYKCEFINAIKTDRLCLPPSAFISEPVPGSNNENKCNICLDLSASFNEEKYMLKIFEIVPSGEILVYNSSWVNQKANKLCFSISNWGSSLANNFKKLKPATRYKAELTVGRNNCLDEHRFYRQFQTPICLPISDDSSDKILNVFPNPVENNISLRFTTNELEENYYISALNLLTNQQLLLLDHYIPLTIGEQNISLNLGNMAPGLYSIFLIGNQNLSHTLITKL